MSRDAWAQERPSAADLLDHMGATAREREAVRLAADAALAWEAWAIARMHGGPTVYTGTTGEQVLDTLGVDTRRWCALASAAIADATARREGTSFTALRVREGKWRTSAERKRSRRAA